MALTKKRAQQRFNNIKSQSIKYRFNIMLMPGTEYRGVSQIQFELLKVPSQLVLDCKAKQVKTLIINGKQQQNIKSQQGFLTMNTQQLKQGSNIVLVSYSNKYDNDGNGCVSFIDVDAKQYIYTQFQPYYANRVFALFDQPDLKAPMQLSVISPIQWGDVLSNQSPIVNQQFNLDKFIQSITFSHKDQLKKLYENVTGKMSIFPKTKLLPTYLYCFVAGPYKKLQLKQRYKDIPMSLYSIQSLFKYLQKMAPFIFEITIQCMKFFQSFFGVDYPFTKYDQVFAHQYKCGAMENAGIVTFNDQYIWRQEVSTEEKLDLANTISHQLSHHWFGNLSTMKWWDDLWLNQSFAEFISHFCLEKIKNNIKTIKYQSSMSAFLARKAWGYHQDQLITTHPISTEVPNTVVAQSIFDGITYSKGAATMKQLLLLIGQQNFSKGINSYFTKYSFKNATLQNFIQELQNNFKDVNLDLKQWRKVWLQTASLNKLQPYWDQKCQLQDAELQIIQSPFVQKYPVLRPHKIKIALFKQDCSYDVIQCLIEPMQRTKVKYNGSNKYKAILLNYQDHTFAKVILDKVSISFFSNGNLVKIKDTLTRTMIWRSFFDMVKDGFISSLRYIDIFQNNIPNQISDSIFQIHFDYVSSSINNYTPNKYRDELNSRLFYFILRLIPTVNKQQQNRLIILRNKLCNFATGYVATKILLLWREGKYSPLAKYQMTLVQKWKAVVSALRLQEIPIQQKRQLLKNQMSLDETDLSKQQQAKCRALISNQQQFQNLYVSFKDPNNDQSVSLKRAIMTGWNNNLHKKRLKKYRSRYYEDLSEVSKVLSQEHFEIFFERLLQYDDDLSQTIKSLKQIKFGEEEKFDKMRIDLLKQIGDLQRFLIAHKKFEDFFPL